MSFAASERSSGVIYIDQSAFLKLIKPEVETPALRRYLAAHRLPWVSSRIIRAEALRAALTWSPGRMADTRRLLNTVTLLSVDLLCDSAGLVPAAPGRRLATLDALHLATAISRGGDLHSLLTYDQQLRDAALGHNLSVASPI